MDYQNLIKASSMFRSVLGAMSEENAEEGEVAQSIEKLKADLASFNEVIDE